MYLLGDIVPELGRGIEVIFMHFPELVRQGEKSAGEEPFGKHVFRGVVYEHIVRNGLNAFLKFAQIGRTAVFLPVLVPEDEVSELEFFPDVLGQLDDQCLRIFLQKANPELFGDFRHVALG